MAVRFTPTGEKFYPLEIVGEIHYQPNLKTAVGKVGPRRLTYRDASFMAILVLEDDNPADSHAVRVEINGLPVGHLSRADAIAYRAALARLGFPREQGACLAAVSGKRNDDGNMIFNVWLDLDLARLEIAGQPAPGGRSTVATQPPPSASWWQRLGAKRQRFLIFLGVALLMLCACCFCVLILNVLSPTSGG